MKTKIEIFCRALLIILTLLLLGSTYTSTDVDLITFFVGSTLLLCALPLMSKSFLKSTLCFIILGIIISVFTKQGLSAIISGINSMLNIVAIIIIMQLFSIPIQVGGYDRALEVLINKRFTNNKQLFSLVTVVTHLFGSFLLFGTIPVMMSLMGDTLKRRLGEGYERFTATAISRGYSLVVLWTPGGINILLVLQATGLKWSDIFVPGIILSLTGIITSIILERKRILDWENLRKESGEEGNINITEKQAWRKILEIVLIVFSLIMLTYIQEGLAPFLATTRRIMNAGLLVVTLWIFCYRKKPDLPSAFRNYWTYGITKAIDLAGLFVSMGLFSKVVEHSGVMNVLQPCLFNILTVSGFIFLIIIPLAIIGCALVGIHPFVSIVIIGNIISSFDINLPTLTLALSLSLGGAISYNVSPFAGIILTMAKYINREPIEVALKWNLLFNIIYFLEGCLIIYLTFLFIN